MMQDALVPDGVVERFGKFTAVDGIVLGRILSFVPRFTPFFMINRISSALPPGRSMGSESREATMRRTVLSVFGVLLAAAAAAPAEAVPPLAQTIRPVSTYSIVARDPETGHMGVAVQSHWFSVGTSVAWAEAGVGAVATQSFTDVSYGPLGLEMLRAGRDPEAVLSALIAADPAPQVRQVAVVDARGRSAAHTGSGCIPEAGHRLGDGYSVQANLMERDTVPDAMAEAFEGASGELAERLLAALEAAQREKGDIRGRQSSCVLVVAAEATGRPWEDRIVDLRVEDHPEPVVELQRLLSLHRAYEHMNEGDRAIERGDTEAARREYGAAEARAPGNPEMAYWHAVALANAGELDLALPVFERVFAGGANWVELTPRLVEADILAVDAEGLARILDRAP